MADDYGTDDDVQEEGDEHELQLYQVTNNLIAVYLTPATDQPVYSGNNRFQNSAELRTYLDTEYREDGYTIIDWMDRKFEKGISSLSTVAHYANWLVEKDPLHVVVVFYNGGIQADQQTFIMDRQVTCNHVSAILMYSGMLTSVEDCYRFYGQHRLPLLQNQSYLRGLYHFEGVYHRKVKTPSLKYLRGIVIDNVPQSFWAQNLQTFVVAEYQNSEEEEAVQIYLYNQKTCSVQSTINNRLVILLKPRILIKNQVQISFGHNELLNVYFNTSFVTNFYKLHAEEVLSEDNRNEFGQLSVSVWLEDVCGKCNPQRTEMDGMCIVCKYGLGKEAWQQWTEEKQLLDGHSFPDQEAGMLRWKSKAAVIEERLKAPLLFTPSRFRPDYETPMAVKTLTKIMHHRKQVTLKLRKLTLGIFREVLKYY